MVDAPAPAKNIGGILSHEAAQLNKLLKESPGADEVYAFGSRTKGTWTPKSDLDIAVFGDINQRSPKTLKAVKRAQEYARGIEIGTGKGHRPLDINVFESRAEMRKSFMGNPDFNRRLGVPRLHLLE